MHHVYDTCSDGKLMTSVPIDSIPTAKRSQPSRNVIPAPGRVPWYRPGSPSLLTFALLGLLAACNTGPNPDIAANAAPATARARQTLSSGDVIKVTFPGATNLDTTQQIRRDGHINLTLIGEVRAADKTPAELEKELIERYSSQLVSKEITVTVVSSSFAVFVTGAVLKPGKISPEREITALEAIMEAGGFDYAKANSGGVVVIRHDGGKTVTFTLDLKPVLKGKPTEPFYLKSRDIVFVPEKFNWF